MNIFIDIETVSEAIVLGNASQKYTSKFFDFKSNAINQTEKSIGSIDKKLKSEEREYQEFISLGGLYPEFGFICCICIGYIQKDVLRVKKITATNLDEEREMIREVFAIVSKMPVPVFVGHNIKSFDLPFIFKRAIVHGINIPVMIDTRGKKPWEIAHIDTMEQWAFGVFNARVSLDDICYCLGIESPKQETSGKDVATMFKDGKIKEIAEYCSRDVEATAKVFVRITNSKETFSNVEAVE